MTPILTFDIETIPDAHSIRILYNLSDSISDTDAVALAQQKRRAQTGSDFMQHHLHRIVAIACCMRWGQDKIHIAALSEADDEKAIISKFFELIDTYTPQLVSWNGGGFDLPVLHYRALIHGITASRYWDMGESDFGDSRHFKWNNYINRYHHRHCDLMDLLALYQPRACVPLDDMAKLCGFPGKLGMDGSQVWQAFYQGQLNNIRNYCETDAVNTYLIYLRFRLMSGVLSTAEYEAEIRLIKNHLQEQAQEKTHWAEFCNAWQ